MSGSGRVGQGRSDRHNDIKLSCALTGRHVMLTDDYCFGLFPSINSINSVLWLGTGG